MNAIQIHTISHRNFFQNHPRNLLKILTLPSNYDIINMLKKELNRGRGAMRHQYPFRSRFPITVETQKGALAESVRKRGRMSWFGK